MENQIIKEFLKTGNGQDMEEYIRDLSDSICYYVKTGNKNELLNNFLEYAVEIKHEIEQTFAEKDEIKYNDCMKKIIYLSHLNILYEMFTQEMQLRGEQ